MKIRYLLDGVSAVSEDVEVLGEGASFYYIIKDERTLLGIRKSLVVSKLYEHGEGDPPPIVEAIKKHEHFGDLNLEYHLPTLDQIN